MKNLYISHRLLYAPTYMFMQMVFSKVHPACHSIVNGIKPGSNFKKTDKHAVDRSKDNMTKKQFLFIQENFHASKCF